MNHPAPPMYGSPNGQNPGPYAFGDPQQAAPFAMPPGVTFDAAQTSFHPAMIPNNHHMQMPSHLHQGQPPFTQNFYPQAQPTQPTGQPVGPFDHKGHRSTSVPSPLAPTHRAGQSYHPNQTSTSAPPGLPVSSAGGAHPNMAASVGVQGQPNASLAQQAQIQNAAQMARAAPHPQPAAGATMSPQAAARERARVSLLLEINTQLLQEMVALQAQGKGGAPSNAGQQSPTSPTSATDATQALNNSPGEPPKSAGGNTTKPASQEWTDCIRRLQANLSYLAAIADAKKKATGALPPGPAIMIPPPHLTQIHDLYKKLHVLFPQAAAQNPNMKAQQNRGTVAQG